MTTPKIESRARIGFFSSFDAVRHVLKKNSSTGMQKKMNASVESAPNTLPGISQPTAAAAKAGKNSTTKIRASERSPSRLGAILSASLISGARRFPIANQIIPISIPTPAAANAQPHP